MTTSTIKKILRKNGVSFSMVKIFNSKGVFTFDENFEYNEKSDIQAERQLRKYNRQIRKISAVLAKETSLPISISKTGYGSLTMTTRAWTHADELIFHNIN